MVEQNTDDFGMESYTYYVNNASNTAKKAAYSTFSKHILHKGKECQLKTIETIGEHLL